MNALNHNNSNVKFPKNKSKKNETETEFDIVAKVLKSQCIFYACLCNGKGTGGA